MKNLIKTIGTFVLAVNFLAPNIGLAQTNFNKNKNLGNQSVVMTWNKDTPEQEMQDDIKALRENNQVIIEYSNVKRNAKSEIIALKISYKDEDGNFGSQEYSGKKPIAAIKFYKNGNKIGFGEPNESMTMPFSNFSFNDLNKQFYEGYSPDSLKGNDFKMFKNNIGPSKIIVQENGKKTLIIEGGKVIEGGDDYTSEEIEKFKKQSQLNFQGGNEFGNKEQLQDKMLRLKNEFSNDNDSTNYDKKQNTAKDQPATREELKEIKKEMQQVQKEIEAARKELNKARTELKAKK